VSAVKAVGSDVTTKEQNEILLELHRSEFFGGIAKKLA